MRSFKLKFPLSAEIFAFFVSTFLFTSINHCVFGKGSTGSLNRSLVPTFCMISSSFSSKSLSRRYCTNFSRASSTVNPTYSEPACAVIRPSSPITCTRPISFPNAFSRKYISKSMGLCAVVTPSAPVP